VNIGKIPANQVVVNVLGNGFNNSHTLIVEFKL